MTEDEFAEACRAGGWGEPRPVQWDPGQRPDLHAHDFDAFVLLLSGELTIASPDGDQTLEIGSTCEVPAGMIHAENAGPEGGAGLLATRSG